jgi:protein phosphatase
MSRYRKEEDDAPSRVQAELSIPAMSLVVLMGSSGAGKSTFAAKHFSPWEVLSSDHYRGVVCNDPNSLEASGDAFAALQYLVEVRLRRGLLTVIDATNLSADTRQTWVNLARRNDVLPVAIVLEVPTAVAIERNRARPDRQFGTHVIKRHAAALRQSVRHLKGEGFRYIKHLHGVEAIDGVERVVRPPPWTDRRLESGPFDIIGDIHGCYDELLALLDQLGWTVACEGDGDGARFTAAHRDASNAGPGRRLVFLGDLCDRGPKTPEVFALVMDLVTHGDAICVPGNHENKLSRHLSGKNVKLSHGLQETVDQLATRSDAFRERVRLFIDGLVSHYILDDGTLVVAHAGMREEYAGRASGRVRNFALYGETTGEIDSFGLPVRSDWAQNYRGKAAVVYGHTPTPTADWVNNTICIDTGCVFGGELTALRWPERELVSTPALAVHYEPARPLEAKRLPAGVSSDIPDLQALLGGRRLETRYRMAVPIEPQHVPQALEVLSRFAVNPAWLIHLPPTMSPSETTSRGYLLEHPDEAFAYYRKMEVQRVVCQEKHMGSRAMVLVGRDAAKLGERFGLRAPEHGGIILSRRGRRFFTDDSLEAGLVVRLRAAMETTGFWEEHQTDWALLDAELMPWSAKATELLRSQYAPVGSAAQVSTQQAVAALQASLVRAQARPASTPGEASGSSTDADLNALLQRMAQRTADVQAYQEAYRRYCWEVRSVDDLRLAPFHLLATEGAVHDDKDHLWHMAAFQALAAAEPTVVATRHREVDLNDPEQVASAVQWWTELTEAGGEGMVVKPIHYLTRHKGRLVQPALKCRGREYLRIIYGPEYTSHLDRLRQRGVGRKRGLAIQEFVLGLESLHRFVERRPLSEVHECVVGVLALEATPVDPRL